ncbi:SPFH domain-containing protein [Streptomyces camelliae]|uniref:SPFH domain-containing protein n=1 Tax=Streptomyces camelliae TaxID=3004093 RepID=A0ABY7P6B7_9ACTN|nr:SPFH domain-containing protein [Streptomyces sp. HUAS 2-6]WBO66111.1 SPFH domain-containing protein [Streptomyces sp. HUAS 2-6]
MSTTTSHTPQESQEPPEGAVDAAGPSARLIQNEVTTEIPVHLLFRSDPDPANQVNPLSPVDPMGPVSPVDPMGPVSPLKVPIKPAVVGLRKGGLGEQSRGRRSAPVCGRVLPEVDPELAERPARVLPGAAGVLAGMCAVAGCAATSWWAGLLPPLALAALRLPASAGEGLGPAQWAAYGGAGALGALGFGGLTRGRTGRAWVLGLFGRYRGTVRRTGLLWVNPLVPRSRVDVRLRHWRSEAMPAVDPEGLGLRVVVLVVWRVRDTARALLGIDDHETYLRECVEAALARVPVDPAGGTRDGDALTRLVAAETAPVGLEVFSVRPVQVEYAPEVAATMHRRRIAQLEARQRADVLNSVVDSVEDTVTRLTVRGLVELDDHERKALVRDLTVAFCSGRGEPS